MTATTRFGAHVTWLAEPHQVRPLVRLLCRGELAERPGVVHGKAEADELVAVSAVPALLDDNSETDSPPPAPPVGLRAADPEWRVCASLMRAPVQGLRPGHVTDVPGISRNDALRLLGNGVVPQQGAAAVRHLAAVVAQAVTAA